MTKTKSPSENDEANAGQVKFMAIGNLRRDVMILDVGAQEDMHQVADNAVRQGRASQVFVVQVDGFYSESHHNWKGIDSFSVGTRPEPTTGAARSADLQGTLPTESPILPALNPENGPQPTDIDPNASDQPMVTIESERRAEAEQTRTEPTGRVAPPTVPDKDHPAPEVRSQANITGAGSTADETSSRGSGDPLAEVIADAKKDA